MAGKKETDALQALAAIAARHPDVETGVACKGTAAECVTYKVNGKAFLYLRPAAVMLKLASSVPEVSSFDAKEPGRFNAGVGGWVTVKRPNDAPLPMKAMEKWIAESYGLMAAAPAKKKAAKKRA
jgi:hypothetical protein